MKASVGIDVTADVEEQGLDLTQVGEQAYDQRLDLLHDIGSEALVGLLNEACKSGNVEDIKILITRQGADPHAGDYDGRYPVHIAAAHGKLGVLNYLYEHHNVDLNSVDNFGGTAILDALSHNQSETVKWLRQRGAKVDTQKVRADLFDACAKGNLKDLNRFLDAGVYIDLCD